jgi:hypothetical protein
MRIIGPNVFKGRVNTLEIMTVRPVKLLIFYVFVCVCVRVCLSVCVCTTEILISKL